MKPLLNINLLVLLFVCHNAFCQSPKSNKVDSLRIIVQTTVGVENISTRLNLALLIFQTKREDAQQMAKSALRDAKRLGNRKLIMHGYFVYGKISASSHDRHIFQTYLDSAIVIANELDDNWSIGEYLFCKGQNSYIEGDEIRALEYFNEALIACRLSDNFKFIGSSYSMMGTIFRVNGLYDKAIEYILKSKLNYDKANFIEGHAWTTYLLGRIYADINLPQQALNYFNESLALYKKVAAISGDRPGEAICYEQISALQLESGDLGKAYKSIQIVLEIHSAGGSKYGLSNAYKQLGKIEYVKGNIDKAEEYLSQSLEIKKQINDVMSQPSIYEYLGLCQLKKGFIEKGFMTIKSGLKLAISNNQKKVQLNIYSNLQNAYLEINDLDNAILCQNKQLEIKDLILSGAANTKMEQLQSLYELEEKNNKLVELEKQNEINKLKIKQQKTEQIIMIIGIFLVSLFSLAIYIFYKQLRSKNKELLEANRTKDKLFSIVSHDLRDPIGSSLGLTEFFINDIENNNFSSVKKQAQLIKGSLHNTFNLLTNLLEWSQSQLQKIEFNPRWLPLDAAIDDVADLMNHKAMQKNISIKFEIKNIPHVFADLNMLKTILRNLLSNAIKFSNKNDCIIISAKLNNNFVEVSIKDHGVGIKPERIENLFELESNATTLGTAGEKGTGLGLLLAKDLVVKQNGKIWAKSEAGKGSIIGFSLKAKSPE